jgi:hypothetical protein
MNTTATRKKSNPSVRSPNTLVIPRKVAPARVVAPSSKVLIHDIVRKSPTPAVARGPVIQSVRTIPRPVTPNDSINGDKRTFLKAAGVVGLGVVAATVLPKTAEAYVMGSSPTSGVVGMKNAANTRIDPATENGNLASIKTNTDPLVASGGGAYVRQDSTATIAKESGGNLATLAGKDFATEATLAAIKTQTDKFTFSGSNLLTSGGAGGDTGLKNTNDVAINPATDESIVLLRRMLRQVDSLGVVDSAQRQKVTLDSISGSLTLGTVTTVGTVSTVTSATNLVALGGVDGRYLHIDTARTAYATGIRHNLIYT